MFNYTSFCLFYKNYFEFDTIENILCISEGYSVLTLKSEKDQHRKKMLAEKTYKQIES